MELNELKKIIADTCPGADLDAVTEETALKDMGLDSLDLAEIIFKVESELGIEVDADKLESIETLKDALRAIGESQT